MSARWHLVEEASETNDYDFFSSVARILADFTGASAVVLVRSEHGRGILLARVPELSEPATEMVLAESPFGELPERPGVFSTPVPSVFFGVPFAAGQATVLCASAAAGADRRVIVALVGDELDQPGPPRDAASFGVQAVARSAAVFERDTERRLQTYRRVVDTIGEVIWDADLQTGSIEWTEPMAQRFRIASLEGADLAWWSSRVHPDDRARVTASFEAACTGSDAGWAGTYRFVRGDGTIAHIRDRCFFTRDSSGRAIKATGAFLDISELHELEQRLALADRMASIGTLAAGLAHEINNPLTYVLGNLDLILHGLSTPGAEPPREDLVQMLREAHQGAARVSEIVRSMRVFARSEPSASKTADVDRVVESALAMAKNEIRHRARLQKRLGAPPIAAANETTLVQVVLNLLMNAAQAIPEGQADRFEIAVSTGVDADGRVFIEVRDTGEGMTAETMRRAFDPFFTTKEVGQGRGLGLSLVHSAVTACGGEVRVNSARGEGATFRLLLPVASDNSESTQSGVVPPPIRRRILIVDDEAPVVRVLRRMLVKDHDILVAASGREALDILRRESDIDVVLCDVMMPDLTGADLHRQLVEEAPSIAERFVFVTGGAFGERARAYVQTTTQPSITKPFRGAEVTEAIQLICRRRSSADNVRVTTPSPRSA